MDRKTIFAFGLILLIILLLPYYQRLFLPQKAIPPPAGRDSSLVADTVRTDTAVAPASAVAGIMMDVADTTDAPGAIGFPEDLKPREVVVETPLYRMTFSTRGAVLTGCILMNYRGQAEGKVQLIRPGSEDNINLVFSREGEPFDLKSLHFKPTQNGMNLAEGGRDSILFVATSSEGGRIEKKFVFWADSYAFDLDVSAQRISELDSYYELHWGSGLAITEADTSQDIYYSKAFALMGGELEKFDGKGDRDLRGGAEGETQWVSLRGKYFEVALLPKQKPANGVHFGIQAHPFLGKFRPKVFSTALRIKDDPSAAAGQFTIFCGPMDKKLLKQVHPRLEATMDWGWPVIAPFSKAILWLLQALHHIIPNYGVVLIVFSIIIKIVIWPLTHKSTKSMSRMSALQPKMKELQAKYKATPEKLNKAMMQLYKDEGVNPFSGCWPMLLQMPLLYALFIVFRSTIELRQAPFIFWIRDLSMPDFVATLPFAIPMYGSQVAILPVFMGITQFLMSRIMVTDPKQKFTVYFMPIFMVLIFNNLPSGLNLYYALFNLWTYLQQMLMQKQGLVPSAAASRS